MQDARGSNSAVNHVVVEDFALPQSFQRVPKIGQGLFLPRTSKLIILS